MPTPKEIEKMRRNAALAQQGDFYVHEVVECVSSDDENCGKEDLPAAPDPATPAAPEKRAEAAAADEDESGDDDELRERWQWRVVEQRRAERAAERGGAPAAASASAPESVATTPGAPQPAAATPAKAASGGDYNQPD